jgi:hypothetical protein
MTLTASPTRPPSTVGALGPVTSHGFPTSSGVMTADDASQASDTTEMTRTTNDDGEVA